MKSSGWIPSTIHAPQSVKRETLLILAIFTCNLLFYSAWVELGQVSTRPWLLLVWLYGLVSLVPLGWRDRAPLTVFATQLVFQVISWPIAPHYLPALGMPIALYAVSVHYGRKVSALVLLAALIPITISAAAEFKLAGLYSMVTNGFFFVAAAGWAWGLGRMTRSSQRHVLELEHERETAREAEVLAAERRRIARELHDIVSHAVTVILLQATGAACVADTDFTQITDTDFTQIKQSLTHIKTTGRQTMAELRRLLWVLETGDPASDAAGIGGLAPPPGLADLPKLLTSLQDAGMPVDFQVTGTPRDLDPSVDLTAYRIMQEGLTNVVKHTGKDSKPRLRLVWKPQNLLIQIDNDTNPANVHIEQEFSGGRGLVGLRERAHAAGGSLNAGPRYEGGYRLTATLPATPPEVSSTTTPCASTLGHVDQGKVSA
jgi:signal transduction histidine kinase